MRKLILTFFYSGLAKKAPGTFGSIAAIFFWLIISFIFLDQNITIFWQNIFWSIFLITSFTYGCLESEKYAKKFGQIDHQSIVLDEVVGQILTLQSTLMLLDYTNYFNHPKTILIHTLLSLIFFRYFDIKKPLIIGYLDKNLKNGLGVMLDDLASGIAAAIVVGGLIIYFF